MSGLPFSKTQAEKIIFDLIDTTYDDPALFGSAALRINTARRWQLRACNDIRRRLQGGDRHVRVLVRACHGAGKTYFVAWLLLWWMTTRYNSRGLTLAQTWQQIETSLWPEIGKLYQRSIMAAAKFGTLLNTELTFGKTWFAHGASSDKPERLEGQHSDFATIRIVDEAKGVDAGVFDATEGLLVAPYSLDLWISTPSLETGRFWQRDMDSDDATIRILVPIDEMMTDPTLTDGERQQFIDWNAARLKEWGPKSPEYAMRALAQYADNAEGALFPSSWLERAAAQTFDIDKPAVAGMDVAGSVDGDQNAVAVVTGPDAEDRFELRSLAAWHERDTMMSKGRGMAIALQHAATLRVDSTGLGKGVADSARQDGARVEEYMAASKPGDVARFANRKAEDAWFLRELLEKGKIAFGRLDPGVLQQLKAVARGMRYEILQTGKLRVIDPADSPDVMDAVIIACSRKGEGGGAALAEYLKRKVAALEGRAA